MNDVLTRAQVIGSIQRYVIDLRVSGGITELAGEMSNVVFSSASAKNTRIDALLSADDYEEFAEKIAALGSVHRELISYATRTAAFRTLAARLILRMAASVFSRGGDHPDPAWQTKLRALVEGRFPGLEHQWSAVAARYGEMLSEKLASDANRHLLEVIDVDWLRLLADEIWGDVSRRPLADTAQIVSPQDLEDFVVLGYEVWSKFRKTEYFRTVSSEVVDRLFEKYGEESLRSVILDMGVTDEMIAHELQTYLRPFLEEAHRAGFLEQQVRARLEPFYRSSVVTKVLAQREP